jgi:fluoride exporter
MLSYLTHPVVLLSVGGAVGTNARYWFGRWIAAQHWTEHFPLATFTINVTGSLLLGLFVVPFRDRLPGWYILLGVGFCGGYTTFSTFALETVELLRGPHPPGVAVVNVVGSVVIGCLVTWFAVMGMEAIYPKAPHAPPVMAAEDSETRTEP